MSKRSKANVVDMSSETLAISKGSSRTSFVQFECEQIRNRICRQVGWRLQGHRVVIGTPHDQSFKPGGEFEVFGVLANRVSSTSNGEEARTVLDQVLAEYPEYRDSIEALIQSSDTVPFFDESRPDEMAAHIDFVTDKGRAAILMPEFLKKVRCVIGRNDMTWLFWSGKRWEEKPAAVEEFAKEILPRRIAELGGDSAVIQKCSNRKAIQDALWWISTQAQISISMDDLDANNWLMNFENGTLDLRTGELKDHDPFDLITCLSPTVFDESIARPRLQGTLDKIIPDRQAQAFLQQHLGSALTGIITHLKLPILYGSGNNGKSTLVNAVLHVLGKDYSCVFDPDALTDDGKTSRSDKPYHLAKLRGKRLVVTNELEEGVYLRGSMLKSMVSNDRITARHPYGDVFEFQPSHKIVMLTNHKPKLKSTEPGVMRRLALVPFDVQIQPGEDDKNFGELLKAEASGILNWLVEGCLAWQANGMDAIVPESVQAATDDYRDEEDVVGRFLNDCVKESKAGFVTSKMLNETYAKWCEIVGVEPMSQTAFGRKLNHIPWLKKSKQSTMKYLGIVLNVDWERSLTIQTT